MQALAEQGWLRFGPDPAILRWVRAALPVACDVLRQSPDPWRCGQTWFVGVDALPNDPSGAVGGVPLAGAAVEAALSVFPNPHWHPAQISVTRPGYPQPSDAETDQAYAYRLRRDAAHLDGMLPMGPDKRRMIREPHGFILGLPLTEASADAAPLVVWEGSHGIIRAALAAALASFAPESWDEVDVTEAYHAARREVFATCRRVELPTRPGEATLLHRLTLHGVAPWAEGASAAPEGRMIAYFRPLLPSVADWLRLP